MNFPEYALAMHFSTPLDLLMLAAGMALIGLSLYLSHAGEHSANGQQHVPFAKRIGSNEHD